MKLIALAIFLGLALIAGRGALAGAAGNDSNSNADQYRYEFLRADEHGVWRLDRRTGKVSYCRRTRPPGSKDMWAPWTHVMCNEDPGN